ncbi:hypothetical protein N7448_008893 [Penicillium atrosanguineum]|uniref:FAD-binding PCMH-type domain-containing protein n=1 Tax=Penicillium atrosanguineum TaxID=1132637 RepID=A0A9W9GSD4_9EURO|nr:hypothetical protein N7448_008893 [Penicillium atrosanguineum]KAJ5148349.1 hypothetical protein N7526_001701 [Penicillium atrosanguineum]KAJ5330298.1 hypothetical protein N7476_000081 [Penicillium atrosanguineum]
MLRVVPSPFRCRHLWQRLRRHGFDSQSFQVRASVMRMSTVSGARTSPKTANSSPGILGGLTLAAFGAGLGISLFWPRSEKLVIHYASRQGMLKAAREIESILGDEAVSYDDDDIETHALSDWSSVNSAGRAVAVVYVKSTDEVAKAVSILPYGAGSSIEGNFSSPYGGLVIDVTYMDKIIAFHPEDMDIVVQPGVNWVDLNRKIKDENLFLPLDPSPTATIGGMIGTNCSGTNAFRYGTMKDWVINVTVVLADGRIIKTRRRPRKTSAGYNLTSLFVGAEGTLGIVTEATLKLAVVPTETSVAVFSFPNISAAASATSKLIRSGIQLAAMELMDDTQMGIVSKHGSEDVRNMHWEETPALFLKFSGHSKESVKADISRTKDIIATCSPSRYVFAKTKDEEVKFWAARKEALWTMTSIKPEGYSIWSTDVAVPISRLADIIEISKQEGAELGVFTSIAGHVGDGNFHEALIYDPKNETHLAAVKQAVHNMITRALQMEGTVSGEHAIGMGKIECLIDELGLVTMQLMKQLKHAVDPM